jgi:hypothetical protein
MNNSNYTLRFSRSYREATGHDAHFERRDPDKIVGFCLAVLAIFVAGMMVGGVL